MTYPETLKIGSHTVNLVFADHWTEDTGNLGEWIASENTIYIRNGLSPTLTFSTLLHEAVHVMNATLDHVVHDSLTEQLSQMLLDNNLISL